MDAMNTTIDMTQFPVLKGIIDNFNEYLNSKDGWQIVCSTCTQHQIDTLGRDACFEEIKAQTVDNWKDNMWSMVIDDTLVDILTRCIQRRYKAKKVSMTTHAIKKKIMFSAEEYKFTCLKIADTDFRKISGIRKELAVLPLLEKIEEYLKEEKYGNERQKFDVMITSTGLHHTLNNYAEWFCDKAFSAEFREAKGTYLKPAKFVRAIFGEHFNDTEISILASDIADKLREAHFKNDADRVQLSENPSEVYTLEADSEFPSCMVDKPESWFKLYDKLPNTCIAYIFEDGLLRARALVHDEVLDLDTGNTYRIMDRIYAENADYLALMKVWAKKNGYYTKHEQASDVDLYVVPEDESTKVLSNICIPCNFTKEQFEYIPYVDTFYLLDINDPTRLYTQKQYNDGDGPYKVRKFIDLQTTYGKVNWLCTPAKGEN